MHYIVYLSHHNKMFLIIHGVFMFFKKRQESRRSTVLNPAEKSQLFRCHRNEIGASCGFYGYRRETGYSDYDLLRQTRGVHVAEINLE